MRMHKILVPVDGSLPSKNTAKYAAKLAACSNSQVVLLHVHEPVPMIIGGQAAQEVRQELAAESAKLLAGYAAIVAAEGVECVTLIREGEPGHAIVKAQEEEGCDIIVMGSRGHTLLEGLMMGSTTTAVLHRSECPVLVTRNLDSKYLLAPFCE